MEKVMDKFKELSDKKDNMEKEIILYKRLNSLKQDIEDESFRLSLSTFMSIIGECKTLKEELLESINNEITFREKLLEEF